MSQTRDDLVGFTSPAAGVSLLSTDSSTVPQPQPQPQATSKVDRSTRVTIELEDPSVRPIGVSY